jgi:acetyl/propionyl-CoA carboxylase alpha subunit
MLRAIDEYQVTGITTTLGFGKFVLQHEAFTSGNFDTHFVKKYFTPGIMQNDNENEALIAAVVMEKLLSGQRVQIAEVPGGGINNWAKNRRV